MRGSYRSHLLARAEATVPASGAVAGDYRLPVARTFRLAEVQQARAAMEKGEHIGKMILGPWRCVGRTEWIQ